LLRTIFLRLTVLRLTLRHLIRARVPVHRPAETYLLPAPTFHQALAWFLALQIRTFRFQTKAVQRSTRTVIQMLRTPRSRLCLILARSHSIPLDLPRSGKYRIPPRPQLMIRTPR